MEFGKLKRNRYNRYDPVPPKPRVRGTGKRKKQKFKLEKCCLSRGILENRISRLGARSPTARSLHLAYQYIREETKDYVITDGNKRILQGRIQVKDRFGDMEGCPNCNRQTIVILLIGERIVGKRCASCAYVGEADMHYFIEKEIRTPTSLVLNEKLWP